MYLTALLLSLPVVSLTATFYNSGQHSGSFITVLIIRLMVIKDPSFLGMTRKSVDHWHTQTIVKLRSVRLWLVIPTQEESMLGALINH